MTASRTRLGAFLLFGTSNQSGRRPRVGQAGPQLVEPAAEGLLAVRDDGDGPDPARVAAGDGRASGRVEVATGWMYPVPAH